MEGQVFKIHSDFYYVNTNDFGILECKLREIIKKQKQQVLVGDFVSLEQVSEESKQAFISSILPRKNFITKPKAANITQAVIVSALKEPEIDFEQLNRYIAFCEYSNVAPVLCFNKDDLIDEENLIFEIKNLYESLGYRVIFTSALRKSGICVLSDILANQTSIFCGMSGAGKSSLINTLSSEIKMRTKNVSEKTKKGVHTTRHCEIIEVGKDTYVVDTPGFSNLRFNFLLPQDIQSFFSEIKELSKNCKFNNCLHQNEAGCNVLLNLNLIDKNRYLSYLKFVDEAFEYKNKITYEGKKVESTVKLNKNKNMSKISAKKRIDSRKTDRQKIEKEYFKED